MKIKEEFFHVTNAPTTDAGDKAEPEQQTVSRILTTDSEVEGGGSVATQIITSSQALEFANAVRYHCGNCRFFDNRGWRAFVAKADSPLSPMTVREDVNKIRGALLMTMNASVGSMHAGADGDMDVEHALQALGFCGPLGEIEKGDPVIVHPLASCPPELVSPANPAGLFKPRDNDSDAAGEAAYDLVMQRAAGRVP